MTTSNTVGLRFVLVGLAAGFTLGILDIDVTPSMYVAVAVICFVTVFLFRYRERTK